MRGFDFTPLYRSSVGFDRLASMLDQMSRVDSQPSYPPYDIERLGEDRYQISMAVAGFERSELDISLEKSVLTIKGSKQTDDKQRDFLHRGIARRNFEHKFQLDDYVEVRGARMEHGLLHLELVREIPEAMKPRTIAIDDGVKPDLIEGQKAA